MNVPSSYALRVASLSRPGSKKCLPSGLSQECCQNWEAGEVLFLKSMRKTPRGKEGMM
jgi:hypothetical protein